MSHRSQSARESAATWVNLGWTSAGCESALTTDGEERCPDQSQRIALVGTHNRWGKRGHCNSADGVCDKMIVNKHSQPTGRIVIVSHRSGGWSSMWLSASESPLTISDKHKGATQLRSCPERNRRNGNKIGTRPGNGSTHDARCRPVKEIPQEPESRAV